jgi:murein L,D-transpeptidase YafK
MKYSFLILATAIFLLPVLFLRESSGDMLVPSTLPREIEAGSNLKQFFEVAAVDEPLRIILVSKEQQRIQVLEHNGNLKIVADYPCATGQNPGVKVATGDACTPEGVYFITRIFKDSKITVFGNRAFHLDYPNIFDAADGRDGNGIYIHGTNKALVPFSTNGCVTMRNDDLDHLVEYMDKEATPVVIFNNLAQLQTQVGAQLSASDFKLAKRMLPPEEINPDNLSYDYLYVIHFGAQAVVVGEFANIEYTNARNRGHSRVYLDYSAIKGWQMRKRLWHATPFLIYPDNPGKLLSYNPSIKENDIPPLYPDNPGKLPAFKPYIEEIDIPPTSSLITQIHPTKPIKVKVSTEIDQPLEARSEKVNSIAPADENQLAFMFASSDKAEADSSPLTDTSPETVDNSNREPTDASAGRDAAETNQVEAPPSPVQTDQPLEAAETANTSLFNQQDILDFIENWRLAWQSKELETYIDHYDESFQKGTLNRAGWKERKAYLNTLYEKIIVNISKIEIHPTENGAMVSFHQVYQSDKFYAKGIKTLHLVQRNGEWGIQQEQWIRSRS